GRRDDPVATGPRNIHLFVAGLPSADEDDELGRARAVLRSRILRRDGRDRQRRAQDQGDTMAPKGHVLRISALYEGAGWLPRDDRGRIALRGADSKAYLHGLLSNDILALQPGGWCYATLLTPQGRM